MKLNKRIITVMVAVLALFMVIMIYLTYFTIFQAPDIVNSTHNQRIWEKEEKILRGTIYDRNGIVLAESVNEDGRQRRIYPFDEIYAHTIGYNNRTYGKTNIELKFNDYLLKPRSVIEMLKKEQAGDKDFSEGASIDLTLDNSMTQLAAQLMGNDNGSVVALNPITGEVYCLYSNPSFDPNEKSMTQNWEKLINSEDSPLFPRATQGLYAPGSTFKVVSAAAGMKAGYKDYTVNDEGKINVGGKEFNNAGGKAYGETDMETAIKVSSNVYFTSLAPKIGKNIFEKTANEFMITEKIPFDIDTKGAGLDFESFDDAELASVSIGQGKLSVSPLHMALVASAIANEGTMMKPYLVEKAFYNDGDTIYEATPEVLSKPVSKSEARRITEYMKECVNAGTGTAARVSGIEVAGKTGTAENEKEGKTHAWFIGFAPADNPQIAVCVMKEYSGRGGGSVCAPIASRIISSALENALIAK